MSETGSKKMIVRIILIMLVLFYMIFFCPDPSKCANLNQVISNENSNE